MADPAKKTNKRSLIAAGVILGVIVLVLVLYFTGAFESLLSKTGLLRETEVVPESAVFEYIPKGTADMTVIEDHILIADESGVSCFNEDGDWLWSKELALTSPVFVLSDGYALAADIGGTGIHAFDKDGFLWTYIAESTVTGVSENCSGGKILVLHQATGYLSAATLLDIENEGKALATRKFGESYAASASFSADGRQLVIAGISSRTGSISTSFTFMNTENYEIYSTETVDGEFLPTVAYVENNALFAAGGDTLRRLVKTRSESSSGDSNDLLWDRDSDVRRLVAAAWSPDKCFVTVSAGADVEEDLEAACEVTIYEPDGEKDTSFQIEGGIQGIEIFGKTLALYSKNELFVYNTSGQFIGKFDAVSQITDVAFLSERVLAVCGAAAMAKADFQ